ncbi:MAG: hypothetical protein LBP59_19095 [Planctomycetaceae bacterium]|jgi:hypothetical protein|nr:hypothetical protein [Planctomycetaceae bacterium]
MKDFLTPNYINEIMTKFYLVKIIIIVFLLLLVLFLTARLILSNNKIDQLENNNLILSMRASQINLDLQRQYTNRVKKNNDDFVMSKIAIQLYPIFYMFLLEDNALQYNDPKSRYEYIRGYIDAWSKYLTFKDANEIITDLLAGKLVINFSDGDIFDEFIANSKHNPHRLSTTFYNAGYSDGLKHAIELYRNIREDILVAKLKYPNWENWQIDEFGVADKFTIKDRISQIPSIQALIILQKIINNSTLSEIPKTNNNYDHR